MDFIDEDDDVGVLRELLKNYFKTLLKLTTVLGTSNNSCEVKVNDALVKKVLWAVARHNKHCKSFHDCGFTRTRFTQDDGVVLLSTRENLCDAHDFLFSTDYRVKLSLLSKFIEVPGKVIQYRGA